MAGLITAELARAYLNYFRKKGGEGPNIPGEVLPVVIVDNNEDGPYPAYRSFFAGPQRAAAAANFSYIGIENEDNSDVRSVVVIDSILVRNITAADDFVIGVTTTADVLLGGKTNVQDASEDKDQAPTINPSIGNVVSGTVISVTGKGNQFVPAGSTTWVRIEGPWTLGPGAVLFVRPATVNEGLTAFIRGRYYPAL